MRAKALLAWFDRNRRPFPWRETRDPYRVWVSEVMLQQTRAEAVVPFYQRFLRRFPTVGSLAAADPEEVLALWSGLGYYRRARQLHTAARRIRARREGFPRTVAGLAALPGVGPYTAAAVASIAFGAPVPVLDGNVERVLSRLLASAADPRAAAVRPRLREAARELLDPERPGDSNQALMELGATVCTPRQPRCPLCPLRSGCRAAARGEPEAFPPPRRRRRPLRLRGLVAVVEARGAFLLFRRPEGSRLLAGTWELPWVEGEGPAAAAALAERYGGGWSLGPICGRLRHAITFRRFDLEVRRAERRGPGRLAAAPEARWIRRRELSRLPVSSLVPKALRQLDPCGG